MTMIKKSVNAISFKSLGFKAEDFDEDERIIKGYLSAFNIKDEDNDIIMPGAFAKSISERGPKGTGRIQYLRYHYPEYQIGKFLELEEDAYGLKFVGQLSSSSKGVDAYEDYKLGIIKEHSIGFNYVGDKLKYDQETDTFFVAEVKLWEGSAVTWGANQFTPTLEVRSMNPDLMQAHIKKLHAQAETLTKAIRQHKGTDEHIEQLELKAKLILAQYQELVAHLTAKAEQPSAKDTAKAGQPSQPNIYSLLIPKR